MHKMTLPEFLKWAFCEELAHVATVGGSAAWSMMASYAALGTVIDTFGTGGAGLPELANVHPDALAANEAVMLLAGEAFELPEGWQPCPDLADPHGLIATCYREVAERRALSYSGDRNQNLIGLVIACAMIGKEPEWRVKQPNFRLVTRSGKPAWFNVEAHKTQDGRVYDYETDGYDRKAGRPKPGAYRKYEIDPDHPFGGAIQARIDWYLWSGAMERMAERLSKGLKSHEIRPYSVLREPWLSEPFSRGGEQVLEIASE